MRRALAGICLAALSVLPAAPLVAAEAPSAGAHVMGQAAGVRVKGDESSPAIGGALYSPFSTAFDTAAAKPNTYVKLQRAHRDEEAPALRTTIIATFIALGLLFALVRILVAG